jgi:tetratricopeptide (TPR) repeat protein
MHESSLNERLERLQLLARANPQDPFMQYALGLEWEKLGHYQQAEQIWNNLLHQYPAYLPAHQRLARLYVLQHRLDEAFTSAQNALCFAQQTGDDHAKEIAEDVLARINEEFKSE